MGGSPRSRQSRGSRGNFSMDPQISTRIPALAQDLVYRRCSINICWLAKGVVGRGRIVREHVAEWMSFNYTQTASRLHDSHSGRQTPGTARPQGLDCSGLRPHRRGQGGNFPARGEVNARDCRAQQPGGRLGRRAEGLGESLASVFHCPAWLPWADSRKTNLSSGTPGQCLEGQRAQSPGRRGRHPRERPHPEQPPSSCAGPAEEAQLGPRWRAGPALQPGRPGQASGAHLAL